MYTDQHENVPDPALDTKEASGFLTDHGFKTSPATLNKYRCIGGGPQYDLFGRKPIYRPPALLEWARSRTKFGLRSTSDMQAA
jgi:hypothetical protein